MQAQRPLQRAPASHWVALRQAQPCARSSPPGAQRPPVWAAAEPEAASQAGWDPEGLLQTPSQPQGLIADHAARRAARRQARQAQLPTAEELSQDAKQAGASKAPLGLSRSQPSAPADSPQPHSPSVGRLLSADPALHAQLATVLEQRFWPVDLSQHPDAELLHLDPPVLRLPGFVAPQTCESIMQFASAGGAPATGRQPAGRQASCSTLGVPLGVPLGVGVLCG